MTRGRGATFGPDEQQMSTDSERELSRRRQAARKTALGLALVVLVIYVGFYLLEAYR